MNRQKKLLALIMALVFLLTQAFVYAESETYSSRDEIAAEYKWDFTDIYPSVEAWEADLAKFENEVIPAYDNYRGKLNLSTRIKDVLDLDVEATYLLYKLYMYASLSYDLDATDENAALLYEKIMGVYGKYVEAYSFITPELMAKPDKVLELYINSPNLAVYKPYLQSLYTQKQHILSDEEEALLAKLADIGDSYQGIYDKATVADMKFPMVKDAEGNEHEFSRGLYGQWLEDPIRENRKIAFETMYGEYDKIKYTLAQNYISEVKKNVAFAKIRNYDSALNAALDGSSIPVEVYNNLISSVNANLEPLHKYMTLRKKAMGLDKVHIYDTYVSLASDYESNIPYEDAKALLKKGLAPLGEEYLEMLDTAFNNNWVDVYETPNKATGAYATMVYGVHPYVLMNYNNSTDSMLTLAHEMGHALHFEYSDKNNNILSAWPATFTAEVASTTNEILMIQYMLNNSKDNKEKLYLLNNLIENIRGSVYTQIMYSEFEDTIHKKVENGEAVTMNVLRQVWGDLMIKYFGEDFELDELATLWWSRIPHFYNAFYVYTYATSMVSAYPIGNAIINGEEGAVDKYLAFLKAGASDTPIEVLKLAGIDMSSPEPVNELLTEFGKLVDQMEQIMIEEGIITE
ncbi:MAG: oligoendopeptidase F [Bacillota bacterium]